jgi:lysophospholipase L1-like esterase
MKKIIKIGFSFVFFFVFLELLLRIQGINQTNEEKTLDYYNYKYKTNRPTWYHTWQPNSSLEYGNGEFLFHNIFNELGHRELSFEDFKQDSTSLKIVFLGDSFTEGDGAPYDSSWVRFFEQKFEQELDTTIWAYNAGVCGSDVIFNSIMLKEKLLAANPSVIFECVNNSDILDLYYRGGKERFGDDGRLSAPNEKIWEPLYKYSYLFRTIFLIFSPYDNNLINTLTFNQEERTALHLISAQLEETYKLCAQNQIDYYVILMPTPAEIKFGENKVFSQIQSLVNTEISILNTYPCMFNQLDSSNIDSFSWRENGHFNGLGYKVLGECIYTEFNKSNP